MSGATTASATGVSLNGHSTSPKQSHFSAHFPGGARSEGWLFEHSKFLRKHSGHEDEVAGGLNSGIATSKGSRRGSSGDEWVREYKAEVEQSRRTQQEELDRQYQVEKKHRQDVDARDAKTRLEELAKEVLGGA